MVSPCLRAKASMAPASAADSAIDRASKPSSPPVGRVVDAERCRRGEAGEHPRQKASARDGSRLSSQSMKSA